MSAACAILVVWTHADFKHIAVDSRHDGPYVWGDPADIDSYNEGRAKDCEWSLSRLLVGDAFLNLTLQSSASSPALATRASPFQV